MRSLEYLKEKLNKKIVKIKEIIANFQKKDQISIVCLIWIYLKPIIDTVLFFLNGSLVSYLYYLVIIIISLYIVTRIGIEKRSIIFLIIFIVLVLLNCAMVNYKNYVFVEGFTDIIIWLIPVFAITGKYFNFNNFLNWWFRFSLCMSGFVLIPIILNSLKLLNYGSISSILLPNLLILSWYYFKEKGILSKTFKWIVFNMILIFLFAGRMAFLSISLTIVVFFFIQKNIDLKIKIALLVSIAIVILITIYNIESILGFINNTLNHFGLHSRNIDLFIEQFKNGITLDGLHLSGRDIVYTEAINYIKDNWLLPSGLGVIRHLTDGVYYHSHNLILEQFIVFGVPLTIIFDILTILFLSKKRNDDKQQFKFLIYLLFFYLILSATGTNFINSIYSILFLTMLFSSVSIKNISKREI